MPKNTLFSKRLEDTLKQRGYWSETRSALDIGRFCTENGYLPSYVQRWLRGQVPRPERLFRLALQLGVEAEWLVGFDAKTVRRPIPIAGGSSDDGTIVVDTFRDVMLLIGRWLRAMHDRWCPSLGWTARLALA